MIAISYFIIWSIVILLSFVPISNIIEIPFAEFYIFIFISFLVFFLLEVNIKTKKKVFRYIKSQKFEKTLFISFLLLFTLSALLMGFKFPILSLFGMEVYRYNEYGIGGVQGFINALWLSLTTIMYFNSVYFNKKNKVIFYILLLYPILLISRQLIISLLIQLFFIWLLYSHNTLFQKLYKIFLFMFSGVLIFGILGNIRVSADGTDAAELLKSIMDLTLLGESLPLPIIWFYIYAVSPMSNLILNLNNSMPSGNLADYFSSILPSPLRKMIYGDKGFEGYSNIVLINENLNMSTAYISPFLSSGLIGIFLHSLILVLFLIFVKLVYRMNMYFHMIYFVTLQVFVLTIFTNVLFYLPIVFQIFIFSIFGIVYEISSKGAKSSEINNSHSNI